MSTQHNNGWVALSERRPTKEDSNPDGYILVGGGRLCASMACWDGFDGCRTHWMRLPPPPETEEQKRARLDEEALAAIAGKYLGQTCVPYPLIQALRDVLAHARQPEARP